MPLDDVEPSDRPMAEAPSAGAPVLSSIERRVLGALVEKAFTTPDGYPLTSNSMITACNQKSARDPVSQYEAHQVDEALLALKSKGLVLQVFAATGRAERWKHNLRDAWGLDRPQLAVLAELFLRGPQSEGDLRARASRMASLATLEDLHAALEPLAQRGFVRRLTPEGRRRGVLWAHLCLKDREKAELDQLAERVAAMSDDEPASAPKADRSSDVRTTLEQLQTQLEQMASRVTVLEKAVEELRSRNP